MAPIATFAPLPTFRDPAGSLELRPDAAYRTILPPADTEILDFLALPHTSQLVFQRNLIPSKIIELPSEDQPLLLRHPRISFQSYPWEWPPSLWLAAAELTLNLCSDLIKSGWLLKDATPLNILFQGTQPILVDLLSVQRLDPTQSIWLAYGQFVRTFLLPMLAYSQLGWPLALSITRRDGYEPEDIYTALPWPKRLRQPALSSVTLPTLLANKKSSFTPRPIQDPEVSRHILLKTLENLHTQMRRATPSHRDSTWSSYAETATHYSDEDHARKHAFVTSALAKARPRHLLDVGCNTGVYSRLAADAGAEVISIDTDLQALDRLCASLKNSGKNILPLCIDLSQPTPSTGWENRENASFLARASGHFDTVMMLAVLHHLLLRGQIPLDRIAALCAKLTTHHLIVEWVPATDPKFHELVRGRESIYAHLTESAFHAAFAPHFTILHELTLANGRTLFHLLRNSR